MIRSAVAALLSVWLIEPAHAEDLHAKYHHFYMHQMQPGSTMSCCNDRDCRPIPHKVTQTGVQALINGTWIDMPQSRIIETETPDQGAHWCGVNDKSSSPTTYCIIVPKGNT